MSCEICGRNNCVKSFHSLEEQEKFDNIADRIKERFKQYISNRLNRLDGMEIDRKFYIKLDDALEEIDDY